MSNSKKSLNETIRSAVLAHKLPNYSKDSVKLGAQRSKRKTKWTSAPSRGAKTYDVEEQGTMHQALKNYLTVRRLRVSRLPGADSVLEAETISGFLDYLRAMEKK